MVSISVDRKACQAATNRFGDAQDGLHQLGNCGGPFIGRKLWQQKPDSDLRDLSRRGAVPSSAPAKAAQHRVPASICRQNSAWPTIPQRPLDFLVSRWQTRSSVEVHGDGSKTRRMQHQRHLAQLDHITVLEHARTDDALTGTLVPLCDPRSISVMPSSSMRRRA